MRLALATLVAAVLALPASASSNPIAAGEGQSCQITSAGAALCWGSRGFGSLGDGLTSPSTSDPQQVSGLTSGVTHITSSWQGDGSTTSTCAISSGAAKCWGANYNGKLGNGSTATSSAVPVDVVGLQSGVTDLSTSAGRACAVHNGAAKCWGGYFLGDGLVMSSTVPVQVTGHTANVTSISAGWRSVCDVMAGSVYCWGGTAHGQLGGAASGNQSVSPVAVTPSGPGAAVKVAAGADTACAIYDVNGGQLRCWGTNSSGQLGNGSGPDIDSSSQVNVTGMDGGVTDISLNSATACAIKSALLYCWGDNQYGMLGTGSSAASSNVPVQVPGLSNVTAVATSANHTCAIANGATMYCWGNNQFGYLGNDTVPSGSRVPVPVIGSTPKPPVTTTTPITTVQPTPKPTATISTLAGKRKVSTKRTVTIATVSCPAGATCAITAPKTVKLKIAKKSYTLTVSATKTLAGGKKLNVGLTLPKKAYAKLKGKSASVSVKVTATATGATPTTLTVRATIKR